jgi:hypothetical protein
LGTWDHPEGEVERNRTKDDGFQGERCTSNWLGEKEKRVDQRSEEGSNGGVVGICVEGVGWGSKSRSREARRTYLIRSISRDEGHSSCFFIGIDD